MTRLRQRRTSGPQGSGKSRFTPEAVAMRRSRQGPDAREEPAHGWSRSDDPRSTKGPSRGPGRSDTSGELANSRPRNSRGLPLVISVVVGLATIVALARVHAQNRGLQIADDLTDLTDEHERLLDRKRRLETERAYLRHPRRIREYARRQLGMIPTPPDRVHRIRIDEENS